MTIKRLACALAVFFVLPACAYAEVYEGQTVATEIVVAEAAAGGTLEEWSLQPGMCIEAGELMGRLQTQKVFATQDGTVVRLEGSAGDVVDGAVAEVAPVNLYTIYCTVDEAYQSTEASFVHSGEQLYIKCTADGTHRAIGRITQIDGDEYTVLSLGGELYIGETVYLYRDDAFTSAERVGVGTVVSSETETYEASGCITAVHVQQNEEIERGELLYEYIDAAVDTTPELLSPVSGIVTEVSVQAGDSVESGQLLARIAPQGSVQVEAIVSEATASRLQPGDEVWLSLTQSDAEETFAGTVQSVSGLKEEEGYVLRILPERDDLPLGRSVTIRIDDE